MKRLVLLIMAAVIALSLCSCDALLKKAKEYVTGNVESTPPEDYLSTVSGEEYSYDIFRDYVRIVEYCGEDTTVRLPSEIEGKPVRVIGSLAFYSCKNVTSVIIPSSVEIIEESAFYYAESLTSITIPDTVKSIGTRAFSWCNSLAEVKLGKGITEIPDYCFNHCIALESVTVPANISRLGTRSFAYCDKLSEVSLAAGVSEIGDRAFSYCAELLFVSVVSVSTSFGKNIFDGSDKVAIIAREYSTAWYYCEENGLRFSTSKSVEAVYPSGNESSDESAVSETQSE